MNLQALFEPPGAEAVGKRSEQKPPVLSLPLTGLSSDDAAVESTQAFGWGCAAVWGSRVWERELPPSGEELRALQERMAQTTSMFPHCLFVAWVVLFFLVPPVSRSTKGPSCTKVFSSLHTCGVSKAGGVGARRGDWKLWEKSHTRPGLQGTAERINPVSKVGR